MADLGPAPEQPQRADDEESLLRLGSHFRERVETDERFAGIHVLQQLSGNERRVIRGQGRVGDGTAAFSIHAQTHVYRKIPLDAQRTAVPPLQQHDRVRGGGAAVAVLLVAAGVSLLGGGGGGQGGG